MSLSRSVDDDLFLAKFRLRIRKLATIHLVINKVHLAYFQLAKLVLLSWPRILTQTSLRYAPFRLEYWDWQNLLGLLLGWTWGLPLACSRQDSLSLSSLLLIDRYLVQRRWMFDTLLLCVQVLLLYRLVCTLGCHINFQSMLTLLVTLLWANLLSFFQTRCSSGVTRWSRLLSHDQHGGLVLVLFDLSLALDYQFGGFCFLALGVGHRSLGCVGNILCPALLWLFNLVGAWEHGWITFYREDACCLMTACKCVDVSVRAGDQLVKLLREESQTLVIPNRRRIQSGYFLVAWAAQVGRGSLLVASSLRQNWLNICWADCNAGANSLEQPVMLRSRRLKVQIRFLIVI